MLRVIRIVRPHCATASDMKRNARHAAAPHARQPERQCNRHSAIVTRKVAQYAIAYVLANAGKARQARALATPLLPLIDAAFAADAPGRGPLLRWR